MAKIIGNTTATPMAVPDWAQTDETKADYIKNKPIVLTEDETIDLIKQHGGDIGVQADWNQTDETQLDYIKNKPNINAKYDKTGGTITGDVVISGNLDVAGTTTTKDTETIMVKDNVVVANSDGAELIEEGGFAIKTSATSAYGIMYDPVGDGVKIGLGAFDANGKFEYAQDEAQFLATRADDIVNNHTVVWDSEKRTFVDSGVDHSELVKVAELMKLLPRVVRI